MSDSRRRKILIVDDHAIFREGLAQILGQESDFRVCGEAENAESALARAKELKPDMVIVDISLEGASGIVLTEELRSKFPEMRILVLSMHRESVYAERALRAGANGYIMKHESGRKLLDAIRAVLEGRTYLSEQLNQKLLQGLFGPPQRTSVDRLGTREFEVFRMIGEGYGTRQIADQLQINMKTVEAHRLHIREKLALKSTFELNRFAREWTMSEKIIKK